MGKHTKFFLLYILFLPYITSNFIYSQSNTTETIQWTEGAENSKVFLSQGAKVYVLVSEFYELYVSLNSKSNPMQVQLLFINKSSVPVDLIPENFRLTAMGPVKKNLEYISPQRIAKKIKNDAAWAMVAEGLASAGRAFAGTSSSNTSGTISSGGSSTNFSGWTTTYNSAENQRVTNENLRSISSAAEAETTRQLAGALLPNTVFPGKQLTGIVHFKRDKKTKKFELKIPIGGTVFIF